MSVAEVMTRRPRTVRPTDTVTKVIEVLETADFRHLPVVDDEGALVGMLSDRDLGSRRKADLDPDTRVEDLMSSSVVSVTTDAEIGDAVDAMLEQRIGAVPVVDDAGNLRGIVSYVDVLRALLEG